MGLCLSGNREISMIYDNDVKRAVAYVVWAVLMAQLEAAGVELAVTDGSAIQIVSCHAQHDLIAEVHRTRD